MLITKELCWWFIGCDGINRCLNFVLETLENWKENQDFLGNFEGGLSKRKSMIIQ